MKKLFLTFVICAFSPAVFGQDVIPLEEFMSKIQDYDRSDSVIYAQKDWGKGEKLLIKIIDDFNNLSASSQEQVNAGIPNLYYNLACFQSLQNKKKEALNAFEKSIDLGYGNYRHATTDSDLDNLRHEKRFIALMDKLKAFDKLVILQNAGKYASENSDSLPKFTYQSTDNYNLKNVKEYFKLDSVAGNGDEISKILNLMYWVHNNISHNGNNQALCEFDAIDFFNYHKTTGKGINCRHLAITLNEMYLAVGIKSRYVTCMPKDPKDPDCHVINAVYSTLLKKWIWIDPTFAAYIKDENDNLLSINEVRERLIAGRPLVLNNDANWNNLQSQTKEMYLEYYMAKNLYWIQCIDFSRFNPESRYRNGDNKYIALLPLGFEYNLPKGIISPEYVTHDPDYFWQLPE